MNRDGFGSNYPHSEDRAGQSHINVYFLGENVVKMLLFAPRFQRTMGSKTSSLSGFHFPLGYSWRGLSQLKCTSTVSAQQPWGMQKTVYFIHKRRLLLYNPAISSASVTWNTFVRVSPKSPNSPKVRVFARNRIRVVFMLKFGQKRLKLMFLTVLMGLNSESSWIQWPCDLKLLPSCAPWNF